MTLSFRVCTSASIFKINKIFIVYFEPEKIFLIMKITNFRGDLTNISAKKEVRVRTGVGCPFRVLQSGFVSKLVVKLEDAIVASLP